MPDEKAAGPRKDRDGVFNARGNSTRRRPGGKRKTTRLPKMKTKKNRFWAVETCLPMFWPGKRKRPSSRYVSLLHVAQMTCRSGAQGRRLHERDKKRLEIRILYGETSRKYERFVEGFPRIVPTGIVGALTEDRVRELGFQPTSWVPVLAAPADFAKVRGQLMASGALGAVFRTPDGVLGLLRVDPFWEYVARANSGIKDLFKSRNATLLTSEGAGAGEFTMFPDHCTWVNPAEPAPNPHSLGNLWKKGDGFTFNSEIQKGEC